MSEPVSFRAVIELWPTKEACAAEVAATASQVSKWWQRDNIPAEWWESLLATPAAIAAGLTAEILTGLAARGTCKEPGLAEARP